MINNNILTINICSFSYMVGLPTSETTDDPNGGGFVFDCRALPNPGVFPGYKNLTGLDRSLRRYIYADPNAKKWVDTIGNLVLYTINEYMDRQYTSVRFAFGCTGGQHRSVAMTFWMAKLLKIQYGDEVQINIIHHNKDKWITNQDEF